MKVNILSLILLLLICFVTVSAQTKEIPKLTKKDLQYIYTFITNDLLNAGTIGLLTEPIIFMDFNYKKKHISIYPKLNHTNIIDHYIFDYKNDSLFLVNNPDLKKIKIKSQIKTIFRDKKPEDNLAMTDEKNCIATLGFGNLYFDGKYFYLDCFLETYPIGNDMNDAYCIYKFKKMPSNGLIYFMNRYASSGYNLRLDEFELTFLYPSYLDRL
jgi:hypothetical protein